MRHLIRLAFGWQALAAVFAVSVPAAAGERIPFQASGLRYAVSIDEFPGGVTAEVVIPDGESNLGDWVGHASLFHHAARGNSAPVNVTLIVDFGGGHTLLMSFEARWDPRVGDFGGFAGTYQVESGTGRFRGARGMGRSEERRVGKEWRSGREA